VALRLQSYKQFSFLASFSSKKTRSLLISIGFGQYQCCFGFIRKTGSLRGMQAKLLPFALGVL